jgi:hypothetical protein
VVSRPHLPAYLWYGVWALILIAINVCVFQMAVWDGTSMMFVPICLLVAFGAPLFLVLRNLTTVAHVEAEAIELRRFFRASWRMQRRDAVYVESTPGIIEGRLRLHTSTSTIREVPGFLVRAMRGTWVEELRDTSSVGITGMSREEREGFLEAARRASIEDDETFGASREERWGNWVRWDRTRRVVAGSAFGFGLISLFFPSYREVWVLDVLIASIAVGISLGARLRFRGVKRSGREITLVIACLLPGIVFTRGQFDWQILDPGIGTLALCLTGVLGTASLMPPWRGIVWEEGTHYLILSAVAFGAMAFWADKMLAFANMRFDGGSAPVIEVASVLHVEESPASRFTPDSVLVELGRTPTFGLGVSARFVDYTMPAGPLVAGGQCALLVRPGLLHVRWLQVATCR